MLWWHKWRHEVKEEATIFTGDGPIKLKYVISKCSCGKAWLP